MRANTELREPLPEAKQVNLERVSYAPTIEAAFVPALLGVLGGLGGLIAFDVLAPWRLGGSIFGLAAAHQISTCVPSSITRLVGMFRYSTALPAFLAMVANRRSRHS